MQQLGPFRLENPYQTPIRRAMLGLFQPALEKTLGFGTLNRLYVCTQENRRPVPFAEKALEALNVSVNLPPEGLARIPASGPLIVVSNHPFGGLEGLVLEALLRRVRSDVKLLANYLLGLIPDLRPSLLMVDPFNRPDSVRRNVAAVKAAIEWVRQGHALGVFPAGEVSHLDLRQGAVVDPPWITTAARIAQRSGTSVLPMFFEGQNSPMFQLLGLIHPRLRTVLLPRELLRRRHSRVTVRVGRIIPPVKIGRFDNAQELTDYLRVRTYVLKGREHPARGHPPERLTKRPSHPQAEPARPGPKETLAAELHRLPEEQLLTTSGQFAVHYFRAGQGPNLLREIGRLREIAFRAVGEGTGKALDLDRFDQHYFHLVVWNRQAGEVVGSYRAGPTDEILPKMGKAGLYTSTLFSYRTRLLEQIGPALELGRSFVRPEYQRSHSPLMLLWRGIGTYVVRHPRYRMLFGPVSISNEYQSLSKQLLVAFLRQNRYLPELAQLIRPRTPPRLGPIREWSEQATSIVVRNLQEVNELIAQIEADFKTMPVLLRQYLKLNGMLLGFNLDSDFGDVLDALMLVDLTRVDRAILLRYMGKEGMASFLAHHGIKG